MAINSKVKGSSFERDIAKKLSLWVSEGKDDCVFNRRSGSGGSPRDLKGMSGEGGDIFAEKEMGKWFTDQFVIEVKTYKSLSNGFWKFITGKTSIIDKFIEQATKPAELYKKYWMLIIKSKYLDCIIITNYVTEDSSLGAFDKKDISIIGLDQFISKNPNILKQTFKTL